MLWNNIQLRSKYNFTLYASPVLGLGFTAATVMSTQMDYESAIRYNPNLSLIHKQVLPTLPSGTSVNPADLTYLLIKTTSGETVPIAHEWVRNQPVLVDSQTIRIIVKSTTGQDLRKLRDILVSYGYQQIDLGFIDDNVV